MHGGYERTEGKGFIGSFLRGGDQRDFHRQQHRRYALCMCILAGFLLVPPMGEVDSIIVGMAQQMGKCMQFL